MNYLKDKKLYLAGAIEFDKEKLDWRSSPTDIFIKEFGIVVFDPSKDAKQQWFDTLIEAKDTENYDKVEEIADKFVRKDLGIIDRRDILVAYLDLNIYSFGTIHEIVVASDSKKFVLIVCKQGKKAIPAWAFKLVPHKHMFGNWEDLYAYLREVDSGKHMGNKKLDFIYGLI